MNTIHTMPSHAHRSSHTHCTRLTNREHTERLTGEILLSGMIVFHIPPEIVTFAGNPEKQPIPYNRTTDKPLHAIGLVLSRPHTGLAFPSQSLPGFLVMTDRQIRDHIDNIGDGFSSGILQLGFRECCDCLRNTTERGKNSVRQPATPEYIFLNGIGIPFV